MLPPGAASWGITAVCTALWLGRHELTTPLGRLSSVHLTVDGNCVVGGPFSEGLRPWVLVTALFHHATRSHVVNNMLMLLATGAELESVLGAAGFLAAFICTGAAGWLCTLLYYRLVLSEAWAAGIAQMQPSVGSSPGTYGLAVIAAVRVDPDVTIGAALGVPDWVACAAIFFIPKFFGDTFGCNVATAPLLTRVLPSVVGAVAASVFVGRPLVALLGGCGAVGYFLWYLFGVTIPSACFDWWRGRTGAANHPCHLGGAALGLTIALATDPSARWASWWLSRQGMLVAVCMCELSARVALDAAGKLRENKQS